MEGRTLTRADAKSFTVSMRVVPAWPMGMQTNSTRPQYFRRSASRGEVLVGLLGVFLMATGVSAEADFDDDEGADLPVEGVDVGGRIGRHSSCVDDVGGSSYSCRY